MQILRFQNGAGILYIRSPILTSCCQNLANDCSALQQLYLAIKDGPEHIQMIWDTLSKLQLLRGNGQIFASYNWLEGYKSAWRPVSYGFLRPENKGFYSLHLHLQCTHRSQVSHSVIRVKPFRLKGQLESLYMHPINTTIHKCTMFIHATQKGLRIIGFIGLDF